MKKADLTVAERLADLSQALRAHGLSGEALQPEDAIALANALHGEARRLRDGARRAIARRFIHIDPQERPLSTARARALLRRPANIKRMPA